MIRNITTPDRIIRLLIAFVIGIMYYTNVINGTMSHVLLIAAAVLALTAFLNFCPIYFILGIRRWEKI